MTADGTGVMKTWSFVEKASSLNNNEAISNDAQYTWTCTHQHVYNEETIRALDACGIEYCLTVKATHNFLLPERWLTWHPARCTSTA